MRKSLICLVLIIFLFSAIQTPTGLAEVKSPTKVDPEAPATMTVANNKLQVSKWAGFSTVSVEMPSIVGFSDYRYETIQLSDGYEVNLILNKPPPTNIFYYPITNIKNAEFYYQPALTAEEIAQGCYRPPEVIGSYAVYGTKSNNEYGTGKIMHIYRPKVHDSKGSWVWGILDYKDGVLSVTVDAKWLAGAVYPVTIDPTFGYTSQGASSTTIGVGGAVGGLYDSPAVAGMYGVNMKAYIIDGNGKNVKMGIWGGTNGAALISNGLTPAAAGVANGWVTSTYTTKPSITASTTYLLGILCDDAGSAVTKIAYDAAGGLGKLDTSNAYAAPGNFNWDSQFAYKFSIYVTYGAAPTITSSTIADMDDTTNVYAMKKYYSFVTEITDIDGATDIKAISVCGMQGATVRWLVNATSLDGVASYAIVSGASVIDLDTASCSFSEAGNVGTLTLKIRAEWDAVNEASCDIGVWARDVGGATVGWTTVQTDYYSTITRLTTYLFGANNTGPSISSPITFSGYVRYCTTPTGLTSSTFYPLDAQFTAVKIYDDEDALQGSNATITNGAFYVNITSSPLAKTTAYHAWLDLVPDYTDGAAPDGDLAYVYTSAPYHESDLITQAFTYYGLVTANVLDVLTAFTTYFATSATNIISLIGSIMSLVLFVSGSLIYWLNLFAGFFIGFFSAIGDILDGTSSIVTGLGDMWAYFGFAAWASAVPVFAFIFWVSSVSSRTAKSGRSNVEIIVGDLQIVTYLVGTIWEWTYTVFNFVVNVIMQFLSVIVP